MKNFKRWLINIWKALVNYPVNTTVSKEPEKAQDFTNPLIHNYDAYMQTMLSRGWTIGSVERNKDYPRYNQEEHSILNRDFYPLLRNEKDIGDCCKMEVYRSHISDNEFEYHSHKEINNRYKIWIRKDGEKIQVTKRNPISDEELTELQHQIIESGKMVKQND